MTLLNKKKTAVFIIVNITHISVLFVCGVCVQIDFNAPMDTMQFCKQTLTLGIHKYMFPFELILLFVNMIIE